MHSTYKLFLVPLGAMLLGACAHEREFRVAYVGSEGSAQIGGDEGSGAGGTTPPPIVAAGNAGLGSAGAVVTGARVVNGSVTSVLPSTNQTLVQLTNGATVLINGTGATLGDLVAIDLGAGRVIGGSAPLAGTTILNRTGAIGQVAGTPLSTAGNLVNLRSGAGTNAVTSIAAPVRSTTGTVSSTLTHTLTKGCC